LARSSSKICCAAEAPPGFDDRARGIIEDIFVLLPTLFAVVLASSNLSTVVINPCTLRGFEDGGAFFQGGGLLAKYRIHAGRFSSSSLTLESGCTSLLLVIIIGAII
jgi:hypothetical protein